MFLRLNALLAMLRTHIRSNVMFVDEVANNTNAYQSNHSNGEVIKKGWWNLDSDDSSEDDVA